MFGFNGRRHRAVGLVAVGRGLRGERLLPPLNRRRRGRVVQEDGISGPSSAAAALGNIILTHEVLARNVREVRRLLSRLAQLEAHRLRVEAPLVEGDKRHVVLVVLHTVSLLVRVKQPSRRARWLLALQSRLLCGRGRPARRRRKERAHLNSPTQQPVDA